MRSPILTLALAVSFTPFAGAQDKGPDLSTSFGVDYTTHYFYRGILREGDGLILQPYLEVSGNVAKNLDFTAGTWNSLHDGATGREGGRTAWYESDWYVSFDYSVNDLSVGLSYTILDSPNGSFATIQELGLSTSWDDSGRHEGSKFDGFAPHITLVKELEGGSDAGTSKGTYFEVGIEPTYQATDKIAVAAPVTYGTSAGDYYENVAGKDDGGFISIGANATTKVSYWHLTVGLEYLMLDGYAKTINANDDSEIIATIGLSTSW
jgi:hypothetical protein